MSNVKKVHFMIVTIIIKKGKINLLIYVYLVIYSIKIAYYAMFIIDAKFVKLVI